MNRLWTIVPAAVVAGALLASAAAAETPAPPKDLTGNWILTIQSPRGKQEPVLKLEKAGDKYVGALTDPRGAVTPVKDVKYQDGELAFEVSGERQGQKFTLLYAAKVTGATLKGKMTIVGRNFNLPIEGRRESPVEGLWKISLVLDSGQKLQPTLKVKQSGGKFTGDFVGISGKKTAVKDLQFKGGELSFDVNDQGENREIAFHYAGKLAGDKVRGEATWVGDGNQKQSAKFEAEKSKAHTADVAGTWKLKVPMKDGPTFEPTVTLKQTGGAVSGSYTGEQGETPVADGLVLGDELTFEVNKQKDGKSYKLRYQGKVNGDMIKGNVDYNFDGITGFMDFDGKRVAPGATARP
jgi:hypothetical protein